MMKLAPEGYPFIIVTGVTALFIAFILHLLFALPFIALTAFMLFFFRDPDRSIPGESDLFVAPADGRVILIEEVHENEHINSSVKLVSIFMSPFNVHVNRSPCDGKVRKINHNRGRFIAAYRKEASIKNENIEMVLDTAYGDVLVRQVAGFLARRAVCRKKEGDTVERGERYGIIKFSSRLDVYLPNDVDIKVKLGDKVMAGETVLAEIKSNK
jgi:phosphatidylserine decarboxylase